MTHAAAFISAAERQRLRRRVLSLEYLTIAWNVAEGGISIVVGILAASVALFAFGLDSAVEVFASAVVVWQLHGAAREREQWALRLIGGAYLVVAVYIAADSARSLISRHHPGASPTGIVFMALTVLVMLVLGTTKRHFGRRLASATVLADAMFTLIDAALSAAVLVGLVLNAAAGWWWADPAMALVVSALAFREGLEGVRARA